VPGRLVPTVPAALRTGGFGDDPTGFILTTMLQVLDHEGPFDVIHSHLEWSSVILGRGTSTPMAATFHGRLDLPWARDMFERAAPAHLVAISESQAADHPDVDWTIVHNGLTLDGAPFDRRRSEDLCFVGRVNPEKGIVEAMEIARLSGRRLRIAAKIGTTPSEVAYNEDVFQPALKRAGSDIEFLGELSSHERDRLVASSYATLMPGAWPEPFGLVAIESLACGTPIIARRVGGLAEIIREGVDGFFGDDVTQLAFNVPRIEELDREEIRASVIDRFSAARMADGYEALYRKMLAGPVESDGDDRDRTDEEAAPAPERVVEMATRRSGTAS
jgi:glycosyltransferase involved in cell wall biosynthesis